MLRLLGKGGWAIMDQGLFAVSNFGLNILLARWLTPAEYGAFSVAYTIFLLLGTFHTAVLTEPMLVFGPGKYKDRLGEYLRVLLRGHWILGAVSAVLFAVVGVALWAFTESPLIPAMFGLAIASPFILFQWLTRRACYVNLQPHFAAYAGALYMVLMVAGVFGLYSFGWLGVFSALGVMACASLGSGAWLVLRLGVNRTPADGRGLGTEALANHWAYGRWAVGAAGLSWAAGSVFYIVLPLFSGLDAVGVLRAAFNFIMPVMQVFAALGSVTLPMLVRARRQDKLMPRAFLLLGLFAGIAGVYGGLLVAFAAPAVELLYGDTFASGSLLALIPILSLLPFTGAAVSVLGAALRALERPRGVFMAYLASTGVSLSVGIWLVYKYAALGAAVGMILASLATGSMLAVLLLRVRNDESRRRASR